MPQVVVAYLYASDGVKGGEDLFPALQLKVAPKKGRLLLFEATPMHAPDLGTISTQDSPRDPRAISVRSPCTLRATSVPNLSRASPTLR